MGMKIHVSVVNNGWLKVLLIFVFLSLMFSCVSIHSESEGIPLQEIQTIKAEIDFPSPGFEWVMRTVDDYGKISETTFTVLEEKIYDGLPVFQISDGASTMFYDKGSRNWIATLIEGEVLYGAFPNGGTFSFPLWVGKSWTSHFIYFDGEDEKKREVTFKWNVENYEIVKVLAGSYKTFRLKGDNPCITRTLWYSPDLKIVVKWIIERYACHYRGPAKLTHELLKFRPRGPLQITKR